MLAQARPHNVLHFLVTYFYGQKYYISVLLLFVYFALCIKFHKNKKKRNVTWLQWLCENLKSQTGESVRGESVAFLTVSLCLALAWPPFPLHTVLLTTGELHHEMVLSVNLKCCPPFWAALLLVLLYSVSLHSQSKTTWSVQYFTSLNNSHYAIVKFCHPLNFVSMASSYITSYSSSYITSYSSSEYDVIDTMPMS